MKAFQKVKSLYCNLAEIIKITWKASRIEVGAKVVLLFINGVAPPLIAYLLKLLMDHLDLVGDPNQNLGLSLIIYLALGYAGIRFVFSLSRVIFSVMVGFTASLKSSFLIQKVLMKKKETLDLGFFDNPESHNLLKKAEGGTSTRAFDIFNEIFSILENALTLAIYFVMISQFNQWLALLSIVLAVPYFFISKRIADMKYRFVNETTEQSRKMDYLSGLFFNRNTMREMRLFNAGSHIIEQHNTSLRQFVNEENRIIFKTQLFDIVGVLLSSIINGLAYIYILYAAFNQQISIGDFLLYTSATSTIFFSTESIIKRVSRLYSSSLFIGHVTEFLNHENSIITEKSLTTGKVASKSKLGHSIRFNQVTFRYPGMNKNVLDNLSFTINQGETVALVGLNGSGKTTIIRLLMRLYDPDSGEILIDGVDIKEYNPLSLYSLFGTVFQDYQKYALTIGENIWLGDLKKDYSDGQLFDAARMSNASDFIEKLPNQYETQLTKRFFDEAVELSTGQWQKLALARSFYRNGEIVILDEPSASIDASAEYKLFNDIQRLKEGKTTILISHRLSSTTKCDRILFLERGKIIEDGNHQQLLKNQGLYAEFFKMQAERYVN